MNKEICEFCGVNVFKELCKDSCVTNEDEEDFYANEGYLTALEICGLL